MRLAASRFHAESAFVRKMFTVCPASYPLVNIHSLRTGKPPCYSWVNQRTFYVPCSSSQTGNVITRGYHHLPIIFQYQPINLIIPLIINHPLYPINIPLYSHRNPLYIHYFSTSLPVWVYSLLCSSSPVTWSGSVFWSEGKIPVAVMDPRSLFKKRLS